MTGVLLDTLVVIDVAKLDLSDWRGFTPVISAVTIAELHAGLELGDVIERTERRQRLNSTRASYHVVPFGEAEAGWWRSDLVVEPAGVGPRSR